MFSFHSKAGARSPIRLHFTISGRVQGVYYRGSTQKKAQELGISGWVRNRRDGAVELEGEGELVSLRSLYDWCKQGPPAAVVSSVEVKEIKAHSPTFSDRGFLIRY